VTIRIGALAFIGIGIGPVHPIADRLLRRLELLRKARRDCTSVHQLYDLAAEFSRVRLLAFGI
jgi:hypothetical protein